MTPRASNEVFLSTSSSDPSCFDLGDGATATAAGIDWSNQTTESSGNLDADSGDGLSTGNDVDAGRHYDPQAVTIESLTVGYSSIDWTSVHADRCLLTNSVDWSISSVGTAGSTFHQYPPQTEFFLICFGAAGEPAVAWSSVPLP